MLKITFEINGRPVSSGNIANAVEQAVLLAVEKNVRSKLAGVRDPETGEFPVVAVRGRNIDNLSFEVSGSEKLIALVKERLGIADDAGEEYSEDEKMKTAPCAFLCHASEDKNIVRKIAEDLQAKGIDTFFDEWEIDPGDSIRQKIDAGLGHCTHFLVLLSPESLEKPWVNAEIDAAFVRKLEGMCHFIPIRHGLDVKQLPPLFRGLNSPTLDNYEDDIKGLINFIHGAIRKPPLGPAPPIIKASSMGKLGLSPAAEAIVRLFIENSKHGNAMDPRIDPDQLRETTRLTDDDIVDAVDELEGGGFITKVKTIGCGSLGFAHLDSERAMFVAFDKHFMDWNPEIDATRIAADLVNGTGSGNVSEIADEYNWQPRRINPAVNYLVERRLVDCSNEKGTHPWCYSWIRKSHATRRFIQDRS